MVKRMNKIGYKCGKCSRVYDTKKSAIACEMLHEYADIELTYDFGSGLWEMLDRKPAGTWRLGHEQPTMEVQDWDVPSGRFKLLWSACVLKDKLEEGRAAVRSAARRWFEERIAEIDKAAKGESALEPGPDTAPEEMG